MPFHGGLDWGGASHALRIVDGAGQVVVGLEARHDAAGLAGIVRNVVCERRAGHQAAMAFVKRSPTMIASCALAMPHSRGSIFHAFPDRFKIRLRSFRGDRVQPIALRDTTVALVIAWVHGARSTTIATEMHGLACFWWASKSRAQNRMDDAWCHKLFGTLKTGRKTLLD